MEHAATLQINLNEPFKRLLAITKFNATTYNLV